MFHFTLNNIQIQIHMVKMLKSNIESVRRETKLVQLHEIIVLHFKNKNLNT